MNSEVIRDDLDSALMHGSNFSGGKTRIYALYQHEPNAAERMGFLKKEYGMGGHSQTLMDGNSGFVNYSGKGIEIAAFKTDFRLLYTWSEVDKRIDRLIEHNAYFIDKDWEEWQRLEQKYAWHGGIPYPTPAFRWPEPEELKSML